MAQDVIIIDSGGANLASLQFALERLGAKAHVSSDPSEIASAPRVLLPGVGAARDAMQRLQAKGLASLVPTLKQPVLGICVGMQLLCKSSEEGPTDCLGILPEPVKRMPCAPGQPIPHMGWNQLTPTREDPLLEGIESNDYVYFVHSYAAPVSSMTLATTAYGQAFSAVVRHANFWGTQFHPERSARAGARLLANFLRIH
jgi:imidazole glycerol-phosphate synthase subunit HisH